jgi:hydrogen peroxide-dependent heme synthase
MSFPLPPLPLTVEGSALLHQIVNLNWGSWRNIDPAERNAMTTEFLAAMDSMGNDTGVFSMYGHKGDLMFVHFRKDFEALKAAEWTMRKLGIWEFMEQSTSYLSVVELGLYESTGKVYTGMLEKGVEPFSEGWKAGIEETMERQRTAMAPRLYPQVPDTKYVCFYPMDRRRGESQNWYMLPLEERAKLMHEHGLIGRRYAGEVKQIIGGSIGLDDWEWSVDLFAEDPLIFKKLIYEMRFDPVSAMYAQFGPFYVGTRCRRDELQQILHV